MPWLIPSPQTIPVPGGKVIEEHVGRVNTGTDEVSIAHMKAPAGWTEPFQAPAFDEYTLVLAGTVIIDHDHGRLSVHAGHRSSPAPGNGSATPAGCRRRVRRRLPARVLARHGQPGRRGWPRPTRPATRHTRSPRRSGRRPRRCCTTTSTGACGPGPIVEVADQIGYTGLPTTDAAELGGGSGRVPTPVARALPGDLRPHGRRDADRDGLHRVARECALDLAADGVVYAEAATLRSSTSTGGLALEDVVEAVNAGFREGEAAAAAAGNADPGAPPCSPPCGTPREAAEIAELAVPLPRRGRRRVRHRRSGGGVPAHPAPRRVRVPPPRERPLHDPRRRGVRAAQHLGGHPVVWRRPARPRGAHRRRHRHR